MSGTRRWAAKRVGWDATFRGSRTSAPFRTLNFRVFALPKLSVKWYEQHSDRGFGR